MQVRLEPFGGLAECEFTFGVLPALFVSLRGGRESDVEHFPYRVDDSPGLTPKLSCKGFQQVCGRKAARSIAIL